MIEAKYEPQARIAADALREALIAVEACGADVNLTTIVGNLATDRTRLCNLFGLNTVQAFQAPGPGRVWSPEHRAYIFAPEEAAEMNQMCPHGLHFNGYYCDDCAEGRESPSD